MQILCFGDSNTYGFAPRSYLGDRYPAEVSARMERFLGRLGDVPILLIAPVPMTSGTWVTEERLIPASRLLFSV